MSDQPEASALGAAGLEVSSGSARAVARIDRSILVGRDPTCQLVIEDSRVSRHHAEVCWVDGGWLLRDLESTNGTYVDGERRSSVTVTEGIEVRLGGADGPVLRFTVATDAIDGGVPDVDADAAPADGLPAEASGGPAVAADAPQPQQAPGPVPQQGAVAGAARQGAAPGGVPRQGAAPAAGAGAGLPGVGRVTATAATRPEAGQYEIATRLRIGRDPDNDVILDDLLVSKHHAEVRHVNGTYLVVDLGSRNGTFHNGRQVPRALLAPGDMISIGRYEFAFDGRRLHQYVDTGPTSLLADDLTVQIKDKVLLDDVSFALAEGQMLALIGPSGCGKSTLLRALTGIRPATMGTVRYAGRDLYADYAELRYRIGMVPQDDVLHRQLTVRRALRFAASLRFADDVPRRVRKARVDQVIETLGLTERAGARIDTLSGGQRKRASVAMELLTEPSLLCLDEPTSGLDPALDKEVMTELRQLADRGRTVIVVTHNVLHLDLCDRVMVLCQGGRLGYFGPPERVLEFFDAADYAEVFAKVTDEPEVWAQRFRVSNFYRQYIMEPMISVPQAEPFPAASARELPASSPSDTPLAQPTRPTGGTAPGASAATPAKPVRLTLGRPPIARRALHPSALLRQFVTLCGRMAAVIGADRGYALFLLGLPLVLALLTHSVPGELGLGTPPPRMISLEAQRLLVVLVVGAAFMGIAPAIREIVAESSIYKRERAVGLSPSSYLASKIVVFTLINTAQVIIFVRLALWGRGGPDRALVFDSPMTEVVVPVALVSISCTVLGLCVSALVRTLEQTTPVLVVAVMTQLVLCGGLFELEDAGPILQHVSWLAQTRWGLAATASTVDLLSMIPFSDSLWEPTASAWWRSMLVLGLHIVALAGAARLALTRLEPGRS
ncbi:MAG: FHA domain-containing protein [Micromonosporaceae bacterium]